jgi:hypothetical protein
VGSCHPPHQQKLLRRRQRIIAGIVQEHWDYISTGGVGRLEVLCLRWHGCKPCELRNEERKQLSCILLDIHRASVFGGRASQERAQGMLAAISGKWCGCLPEQLPASARAALVAEILQANWKGIVGAA